MIIACDIKAKPRRYIRRELLFSIINALNHIIYRFYNARINHMCATRARANRSAPRRQIVDIILYIYIQISISRHASTMMTRASSRFIIITALINL